MLIGPEEVFREKSSIRNVYFNWFSLCVIAVHSKQKRETKMERFFKCSGGNVLKK